jgi:hypothetical protein
VDKKPYLYVEIKLTLAFMIKKLWSKNITQKVAGVLCLAVVLMFSGFFANAQTPEDSTDDTSNTEEEITEVVEPTPPPPTSPACPLGNEAIQEETLTITDLVASATFNIPEGCQDIHISLASYSALAATFMLPQILLDSKTGFFDPGDHTLQVNVDECFYQVDLVEGPVIENLTVDNLYGGRLLMALTGGEGCPDVGGDNETPPPPPPPSGGGGGSTTPTPTPTPVPPPPSGGGGGGGAPTGIPCCGSVIPPPPPPPGLVLGDSETNENLGDVGGAAEEDLGDVGGAGEELPRTGSPLHLMVVLMMGAASLIFGKKK